MTAELTPIHTPGIEPALSAAAQAAVRAGVPASTLRSYREDLRRYLEWCSETGHPGLPCTADLLTEYATYMAYTLGRAPAYIERSRWAITKWHKIAEVAAPGTQGFITVIKGYRDHLARTKDPKAKTRKATAVTPEAIRAMFAIIDRSGPAGCRDRALLLLMLATGARISELSAMDIGDIEMVDDKGMLVTIYRGKVRKLQELPVAYAQDPDLCPVRAAQAWIAVLMVAGDTQGPLFRRVDKHGHIGARWVRTRHGQPAGDPDGRMIPEAVAEVMERRAGAAGLAGNWTGHAGRIGFATAAYRAGVDLITIADYGGWMRGSKAMLGYIEEADKWDRNPMKGVL